MSVYITQNYTIFSGSYFNTKWGGLGFNNGSALLKNVMDLQHTASVFECQTDTVLVQARQDSLMKNVKCFEAGSCIQCAV